LGEPPDSFFLQVERFATRPSLRASGIDNETRLAERPTLHGADLDDLCWSFHENEESTCMSVAGHKTNAMFRRCAGIIDPPEQLEAAC